MNRIAQLPALRRHARRIWRALLGLLLLAVSYLSLTPDPPPYIDTGWDKANHLLAFAALAFAAMQAFAPARWKPGAVALALLAYGALIELLQSLVPGRFGEIADVLADALGIGLGLVLAWAVQPRRSNQLESDPN